MSSMDQSKYVLQDMLSKINLLTTSDLEKFLEKIVALKIGQPDAGLSIIEKKLLVEINRRLPESVQERYEELTNKRWEETLTESEHKELLQIIDQIEELDIKKAQAVLTLSQIRGVTAQELLKSLEIHSSKDE